MLWTIFVILMILWLLGMISGYVIGGFIHILRTIDLKDNWLQEIFSCRPSLTIPDFSDRKIRN